MSTPITAASLFEAHFRSIYPPEQRDDLAALIAARSIDANPGRRATHVAEQTSEALNVFAELAPGAIGRDDLGLDCSDASVHRLGAAIDRTVRDRWLASTPSPLVQIVTHGALYIVACILKNHRAVFGARRPLWESVVTLHSHAGVAELSPFHWWLRALSDDEIDRATLTSRYRQLVEIPSSRPDDLPSIVDVADDRKLPTLATVRYDTLHKYLRAHLPELRDLGRDFPDAAQLDELRLLSLDFVLLGAGRMLLMHGRGKKGLHLFWLDHRGFSHAMLLPASAGDPHAVGIDGDKLTIRFVHEGRRQTHEMLWWG